MSRRYSRAPVRYLDAARHMRRRQILFRARRLFPPGVLALGLSEDRAAEVNPSAARLFASGEAAWGPVPEPAGSRRFSAAGATRAWGADRFWEDPSDGLLFLFALHSFVELARYGAGPRSGEGDEFWREVLSDWLAHHRRPGYPAWHPYPLSGRILSWLSVVDTGLLPAGAASSLAMQAAYLARTIEHDIGGNHVLHNAVALSASGLCLGDDRLTRTGMRLLESELAAQLLLDGGHEERSPAYHEAIRSELDDLAELMSRLGMPQPGYLEDARGRMARWVDALVAPGGEVPRLNDAWSIRRLPPEPGELEVTDLADTGYVVLRHGNDHIVLDVGPLCPPHLPAHAHADALGFLAWFNGQPVVTDPGIGHYEGPLRDRFRGTAAHATVAVDAHDQCHLWGSFRAAGLPNVRRDQLEQLDGAWLLRASHDGYRRLEDPVVHHRLFVWLPDDGLVVVDQLVARAVHHVRTSLPLAGTVPQAPGEPVTETAIAGVVIRAIGEGPPPRVERGLLSPFLGITQEGTVLNRSFEAQPFGCFGWSLLRDGASAELSGQTLTIHSRSGAVLRLPAGQASQGPVVA